MKANLPTKTVQEVDHEKAGELVRAKRIYAGLSLRSFAKRMGFSAPFISDLERGNRNWTEARFQKAVQILNKFKI